ncbi:unnamed protein product, partial [Mesorhabditis spiculigera]
MTITTFNPSSYDDCQRLAEHVRKLVVLPEDPQYGIICGSGFGHVAEALTERQVVPFELIPGFPKATVEGHSGNLVFGYFDGKYICCQQGRIHPYEHHMNLALCATPVRIMYFLGVKTLIATNAVGAVNKSYITGDFMVYKDHIFMPGMVGFSPLIGSYDKRWGARFVPSAGVYDPNLREQMVKLGVAHGYRVHEGIYAMLGGPQYESTAEIDYLRLIGADIVGMSVSHEALVGHQMGIRVLAMALITNDLHDAEKCGANLKSEDVLEAADEAATRARSLILGLISQS